MKCLILKTIIYLCIGKTHDIILLVDGTVSLLLSKPRQLFSIFSEAYSSEHSVQQYNNTNNNNNNNERSEKDSHGFMITA